MKFPLGKFIKIMINKVHLFPSRTFQIELCLKGKHHGNYLTGDLKPLTSQKGGREKEINP